MSAAFTTNHQEQNQYQVNIKNNLYFIEYSIFTVMLYLTCYALHFLKGNVEANEVC